MNRNPNQNGSRQPGGRVLRLVDSWYGVLLLAGLVSFVMMYHHIVPLNGILFTDGPAGNDWGQMVWNLWFVNDALSGGHNPYFTNLLYYPVGANLTHHTLAAGFFPITLLAKLVFRGDPLYPVYAYHIIIFLCFLLLLACSYVLLRELSFTRLASATAACAYAFCDYYQVHTLHLNLIPGFFIPLTGLFLVRAYRDPQSRNLHYAAFVSAVAVYFTEYALFIYLAVLVFAILMLCFQEERRGLMEFVRRSGSRRVVASMAIFLLVLAPFGLCFFRGHVINPAPIETSIFSANLASFFIPGAEHWLLAKVFAPLNARVTSGVPGLEAFLGYTLIVFGVLGLLSSKRRLVLCAAVTALVFYVLCLGSTLKVFGTDTGIPMPYAILTHIPPFDMGRTPVRFLTIGTFLVMIVAASGIAWLQRLLWKRYGNGWAMGLISVVLAVTAAGAYTPIPRRHAFTVPDNLPATVSGPVFNVPLRLKDGYGALLQTLHHQPISTGYIARSSPEIRQHFLELKRIHDQGGPEFCGRLAAMGFRSVIVTGGELLAPLQLSKCTLPVIDLRADESWRRDFPGRILDEAPKFPEYNYATIDFGLAAANQQAETADKYLWYGWSEREPAFRWTDRGVATITFAIKEVSPSTLRLRMAPFLAEGKLARQRVEVQLNDQLITSLTLSDPVPREYEIELPLSALRKENVLTFTLPDALSPQALGLSPDIRLLGISVYELVIVPGQNRLR
ncbi:MAG: hypothetical protein QOD75_619 [Blastocatellia bacterium]|jgi:hypothetical protein|nr:hypothetical protein [Blastocatellia bacterium]